MGSAQQYGRGDRSVQDQIARDVVNSGKAWFPTTRHAGHTWLRFNMVNLYTREHHIRQFVDYPVSSLSVQAQ